VDPITGAFVADGTGHDRVLDSIDVTVRPDGTAANIEITLASIPTTPTQPPIAVIFKSTDATVAPLPPVSISQLGQPGVGQAISALLANMTACYAVPLTQRVNNAPGITGSAVGGPADIVSPTCRGLFAGDDPAQYLSGGSRVGRDASGNGSFAGIWRGNATGAVFDQGSLARYRPNGDVVFRYHTAGVGGSETFDTLVARYEGGALKLIGNQYVYNASIRPAMAQREYVNASGIDWVGVGYNLFVSNQTANGASVFSKVLITSPAGKAYTMLPSPGSSYLGIADANGQIPTVTGLLFLNGMFNGSGASGDPRSIEPGLFVDPTVWTDAQISVLNNQSVWTMEFFHVDTTKANVVQTYRTDNRPLTSGEARTRGPFSDLTPGMRTRLVSQTVANGVYVFGAPSATTPNVFDFSDGGQPAWSVPSTATGPTLFSAFGRSPLVNNVRIAFNDDTTLASTTRSVTSNCTIQTSGDPHCDTTTGVTQYAQNSYISTLQLFVHNQDQMDVFSLFALYRVAGH